MRDKTISKPEYPNKANALRALKLIKIYLLLFLIGICIVGKTKSTWPMISWALYSEYSARFRPPEPSVAAVELRVYTETGKMYVVKPEHILTLPRDSLSHKIVEQAFNNSDLVLRDASRKYLLRAVSSLIDANSEIKSIQAWSKSYQIEPLTVPPIKLQTPATEVMLGSFSQKDFTQSESQEKNGSS